MPVSKLYPPFDDGTPFHAKFCPTLGRDVVDSILEQDPTRRVTGLPFASLITMPSFEIDETVPLPLLADPLPFRQEKSAHPEPDRVPEPPAPPLTLTAVGYPNLAVHIEENGSTT